MRVGRMRLQTYEQYCGGDKTCDGGHQTDRCLEALVSVQCGHHQTDRCLEALVSVQCGHRQTDRCLEALVSVQGSVLTVTCVCSTHDGSYSTCDAARQRLPYTPSQCAGECV